MIVDYLKQYRSFINSHYLSEGVRMTVGILLPVLIANHYQQLPIGMTIALGALSVSITDNPGPIHHRRNGLIACNLILFGVSLLTALSLLVPWCFFFVLTLFCFFFSMIGVYGTRATSVGIAALLVMVLQTEVHLAGRDILYHAFFILIGGSWYVLLSLVLYSIRPYKLMQQALGEYVMTTADYLRVKASFYADEEDYGKNYHQLLNSQIAVQEKQNLVAELIFKTRSIVKDSTHTGRVLMMIFLDVSDLFERAMTSHQDYEKLHAYFNETGILDEYRQLILTLANEMDEIGIALKSGRRSGYDEHLAEELVEEREHLKELRLKQLVPGNLDGFISLRHILDSIDDIAARIRTLHHYTSYDSQLRRKKMQTPDPEDFISHQGIDPKLIIDNLNLRSNIFRHSLRITAAAVFAYVIAQFLPVGHSYWILLTVIVILKPGYSLTRRRNLERLSGTFIGAAIGILVLYLVKDKTAIVILLGFCMIGAYSFMRKQYLVSVILMTVYLLLMFHLLDPKDFKSVFTDRIIDTTIGSVIAVLFGYLLAPVWEHEQIHLFMQTALEDATRYYQLIAGAFTGEPSEKTESRVARRNSWVSLANLSDAFTRMLSEPKTKQHNKEHVHQFVVAIHMLVSHIATLAYYTDALEQQYINDDYRPLVAASGSYMQQALQLIKGTLQQNEIRAEDHRYTDALHEKVTFLMRKRQGELEEGKLETDTRKTLSQFKSITDQFYFIYKIAMDIQKVSGKINAAPGQVKTDI